LEEERKLKEEERKLKEEERKLKEEERKLKEEAIMKHKSAIKFMIQNGISLDDISNHLMISLDELKEILK
jgi:hypothetical protein